MHCNLIQCHLQNITTTSDRKCQSVWGLRSMILLPQNYITLVSLHRLYFRTWRSLEWFSHLGLPDERAICCAAIFKNLFLVAPLFRQVVSKSTGLTASVSQDCSRDVAIATKFWGRIGKIGLLHLNLSYKYSTMDWKMITMKGAYTTAIILLYRVEIWWALVQFICIPAVYLHLAKIDIRPYISEYWINLHHIFRIGRRGWVTKVSFVLQSIRGCCYGNINFWGKWAKLAYLTFSLCTGVSQ